MVWTEGQKIQGGKYVIEEVLGQGGFGITYKALHVELNQHIVIKSLKESLKSNPNYDKYKDQFLEEGRLLAQLSADYHPNIVQVHDLFMEGETYCLVMNFISEINLLQLVEQRGALPEEKAVNCIRQIGEALAVAHHAGWVHRDCHPKNILLQRNGQAVLIDFGIASKIVPNVQNAAGDDDKEEFSVTHAYNKAFAPPEQRKGKGDREPTVDVYCLAATLYYVVTGQYPATSYDRIILNVPLIEPKQYIPSISRKLNQAILKGMELEPKDRPQSMQAWLKFLSEENSISTTSKALIMPGIELKSVAEVNYQPLKQLLYEKKWRDADRETADIILKVTGREKEGWIGATEFHQFPCEDIKTINNLWIQYSRRQFGFSIQVKLWQKLGGNNQAREIIWQRFLKRVNWYTESLDGYLKYYFFRYKSGCFPTLIKPDTGILIGRLTQQSKLFIQEDIVQLRQETAEAQARAKAIKSSYDYTQNRTIEWQKREKLALASGNKELVEEALKNRQMYASDTNRQKGLLDEQQTLLDTYIFKLRNSEKKIFDGRNSLIWPISILESKLKECSIP